MESALGVTYDLILDLRAHIFEYSPETNYRHAVWNTCNRLVQKKTEMHACFLRKRLTIVDLFEGL